MKVLVFGYGSMGKRHAKNAAALGHTVAVCDTDAYRLSEHDGVMFYEQEKAWDWEPDAVVIATPAKTHRALHMQAVGLAIPSLIEKPIYAESSKIGSSYLPGDRVGYNLRFVQDMPLVVPSSVRTATFTLRCDMSAWPGSSYESMLLEGSHEIDLALWLLGPAVLTGVDTKDDVWMLQLRHVYGAMSRIELNGRYKGYDRSVTLMSDFRHAYSLSQAVIEFSYAKELDAFLSGGAGCTVSEALAVLKICDAAREAGAWRK